MAAIANGHKARQHGRTLRQAQSSAGDGKSRALVNRNTLGLRMVHCATAVVDLLRAHQAERELLALEDPAPAAA